MTEPAANFSLRFGVSVAAADGLNGKQRELSVNEGNAGSDW
jgi:hypothetical protein